MVRSESGGSPEWQPDREAPVPLFLQIRQHLVGLIADWPDPGQRFHTESELAQRFGVTKATIRQALSELTRAGLLRRRRGSGTYVMRPQHVERLRPGLDIARQYETAGVAVTTRVLGFETRIAHTREARTLDLAPDTPVVAIRRVRSVAHVPLAIDDRVLAADLAARAGFNWQRVAGSIVGRLGAAVPLGRASWELEARLAGEIDAALLQTDAHHPVLVRSLVYHSAVGDPVMTGETRHRSDLVRCGFEIDLGTETRTGRAGSWASETFAGIAVAPDAQPVPADGR